MVGRPWHELPELQDWWPETDIQNIISQPILECIYCTIKRPITLDFCCLETLRLWLAKIRLQRSAYCTNKQRHASAIPRGEQNPGMSYQSFRPQASRLVPRPNIQPQAMDHHNETKGQTGLDFAVVGGTHRHDQTGHSRGAKLYESLSGRSESHGGLGGLCAAGADSTKAG